MVEFCLRASNRVGTVSLVFLKIQAPLTFWGVPFDGVAVFPVAHGAVSLGRDSSWAVRV